MDLVVKHDNKLQKQLSFRDGPIYIGRQLGSQVFLPDKAVSRQHAVIYTTTDGKWILEDLDSANKTYLNGKAVHKSQLQDGDVFKITNFSVEVRLRDSSSMPAPINMDDTLINSSSELHTIKRKITDTNGPAFRLSPKDIKAYSEIMQLIPQAGSREKLIEILVSNLRRQLLAFRIWIGFKKPESETFDTYKGHCSTGQKLELNQLYLKSHINSAMQKKQFILIPKFKPEKKETTNIRSVLIAPILDKNQCYGVIYIANSLDHQQYEITDLNYLTIVSLALGPILEKY